MIDISNYIIRKVSNAQPPSFSLFLSDQAMGYIQVQTKGFPGDFLTTISGAITSHKRWGQFRVPANAEEYFVKKDGQEFGEAEIPLQEM